MVRWAVVGSGKMASVFLADTHSVANSEFVSVFSHSPERAKEFAKLHELESFYSNYDELLSDDSIDAVYIASTHEHHGKQSIAALKAGKHVLCEKPMALSKKDAEEVYATAKANKRFCAEALWTRFNPAFIAQMNDIKKGRIGDVKHVQASFGFTVDQQDPKQRLLNPKYAGGALLDIGIYPILLPLHLLGLPNETMANVRIGSTGVDIATDLILKYDDDVSASLSYRFDCHMPTKATVSGTKGWVELEAPWFANNAADWSVEGKPVTTEHYPLTNRGYGYEIQEVSRCIEAGLLESPIYSWKDSIELLGYLDEVRSKYGPRYPFEKAL